jgi:hypothetical protein
MRDTLLPPNEPVTHSRQTCSQSAVYLSLGTPIQHKIWTLEAQQPCSFANDTNHRIDMSKAASVQNNGVDTQRGHFPFEGTRLEKDHGWADLPPIHMAQKGPKELFCASQPLAPRFSNNDFHRLAATGHGCGTGELIGSASR